MKIGQIHFARSARLTEYLRYVWSRPVPARIPIVEALSLPLAAPVPIKKSTERLRVLAPDVKCRVGLEHSEQLGRLARRDIDGIFIGEKRS